MKEMKFKVEIIAELNGNLQAAAAAATGALTRLKNAASGRMQFDTGSLSRALGELKKMESALRAMRERGRNPMQGALGSMQAADKSVRTLRGEVTLARSSLSELDKKIKELGRGRQNEAARSELRAQRSLKEAELKGLEGQLKQAQNALKSSFGAFNQQKAELASLQAALKAAGLSTTDFASAQAALKGKVDAATASLKAQERLNTAYQAHNEASANFNNAFGNMQSAVSTAGAIMQPLKAAVDNAETFEHAMSKVKALTQSTNIREGRFDRVKAEMAELEAQARELGATTQFTMTQAAEAQGYLGMAGWSKDQIIKAMPGMLDLAAASGMDLARTADIVSDNMTALGLRADQVGHMTDVYAYALTRSNLNMEALGESMKYAAPAMAAYGGDIHDAAAAMMIMGNAGIKGSMAGTALRMGLLRLAGPPKKATKEMEALGVSLSDATRMAYESQAQLEALGIKTSENMVPTEKMSYVLRELSTKMQGLSQDEKLAAVGAIFGVNAASGWLAILEQGSDAFDEFRDALRTSDGTAKQVASTMNSDTRGAWLYLESAIDAVSNNVGTAFLPALKSIYEGLNPVVTSMAQWIGEHPAAIQAVGGLAATVATGVLGLGAFRLGLAGISFVSTTVELMKASAAFSALSGSVGIVSAAFAGVKGIASAFAAGGLTGGFEALSVAVSGAARAALGFIATPWGIAIAAALTAAALIYENWDKFSGQFDGIAGRIGEALNGAFEQVSASFGRLGDAFGQVMEAFSGSGLGTALTGVLMGALELVTGVVTTAITLVGDLISTIGNVGGALMSAFGLLMKGEILGAIGKVREAIGSGIGGVLDMVKDALGGIAKTLNNIISIGRGLFNGSIQDGTFDWSSLGGGKSKGQSVELRERVEEVVAGEVKLSTAASDEYEMKAREIARKGGYTEDMVSAYVHALKGQGTQTELQQEELLRLTSASMEGYVESEAREAIMSEVRTSLSEIQTSTADRLTMQLNELSKETVTDKASKDEFMLAAESVIASQTALTTEQQSAILTAVQANAEQRLDANAVAGEFKAALEGMKLETLSERDSAVTALKEMISAKDEHTESAKLEAALEAIRTSKELGESAQKEMIAQLEEAFKADKEKGDESKAEMAQMSKSMESASKSMESASKSLTLMQKAREMAQQMPEGGLTKEASDAASKVSGLKPEYTAELSGATQELSAAIQGAAAEQAAASGQMSEFGSMLTSTGGQVQVLAESSTAAGSGIEVMTGSALGATGGIEGLAASATGAQGGVGGLGSAASGASGSISGLGAAASSAIGALMSAASSAGSAIMGAVSAAGSAVSNFFSGGVSHNAIGGIYPRGEFLTTFAESSPEAAIPIIPGNSRSISLWQQTGAMLGVYNQSNEMSAGSLSKKLAEYDRLETQTISLQTTVNNNQSSMPPITVNFTFSGNVDQNGVRQGVEDAMPMLRETFEEQMSRYQHERERVSF